MICGDLGVKYGELNKPRHTMLAHIIQIVESIYSLAEHHVERYTYRLAMAHILLLNTMLNLLKMPKDILHVQWVEEWDTLVKFCLIVGSLSR